MFIFYVFVCPLQYLQQCTVYSTKLETSTRIIREGAGLIQEVSVISTHFDRIDPKMVNKAVYRRSAGIFF